MGKDHQIKVYSLLARCCHGSCLGFGFVITTVTFATMFWIIWCYLGFSIIHSSDTQRRAIVSYSQITSKNPSTFRPTSSPSNPEVSLNQIPNSSTATLDIRRNDSPLISEKQEDLKQERSSVLAKSVYVSIERDNRTSRRDTTTTERSPNQTDISIKYDSSDVRTVSTSFNSEQSVKDNTEDGTSNIPKNRAKSMIDETATKRDDIQVESSDIGKDGKIASKSRSEEEKTGNIGISNKQAEGDSSYIDPDFIRENSRIPKREESGLRYDSRTRSEPSVVRNQDEFLSKDDRRDIPDLDHPSRNGQRIQSESRDRGKSPSLDSKYLDSDNDQRKSDDNYRDRDRRRSHIDKYDDISGRDVRHRDQVSEEQYHNERKRTNVQSDSVAKGDMNRDKNLDERYSRGTGRDNRERYDERYRHRIPIDDRYNDRYSDRVPVDEKYDDRYRDRVPVDDKYDDRYRDRALADDKYDDRYRDRAPVNDKYDDRYRDRVPIDDKHDDRYRDRMTIEGRYRNDDRYEGRYRDRVPDDDKYIERYPDERRRRGDSLDSEDKTVKEYRLRDRVVENHKYSESGRRGSSEDRYEYRPKIYDTYRDEVRKREDDSKIESTSQSDGKLRPREEPDHRDDTRLKSSDGRFPDRNHDNREDSYYDRDRFRDEGPRTYDINKGDNLQSSRSRDAFADRYDDKEVRRNRERIPQMRDTSDYTYPSRTDDKRYISLPSPRERDLLSSRAEYEPLPIRISPVRREYSTRNGDKDFIDDVSDKELSRSSSKNYNTENRKDGASESQYENGYRNQEYQSRSRYDDRDKIAPTKITDSQYLRHDTVDELDKYRPKPSNMDRKTSNEERSIILNTKEVVLDHRSYSSDDDYDDRNKKFPNPTDSRDRNNHPTNTEGRDYRYKDSPSGYSYGADEYKPSRRRDYEETDYPKSSDSSTRDIRYDKERGSNVRNQDSDNDRYYRDRDVYRDSRFETEETSRRNRKRAEEERYDDRYETRSYARYPSLDSEYRKENTARPIRRDSAWDENSQSRDRRYRPDNERDASSSRDILINQRGDTIYSDDESSMKSRTDRNPLPLNRGSESRKRTVESSIETTSRRELKDGASDAMSSAYDPEKPLSAKDVIDAALRLSEVPGQTEKKVFYPVFDPRVSNLTSPDIIRPSDRRGITVTSKKKRKR